jgi:hypothetical protein
MAVRQYEPNHLRPTEPGQNRFLVNDSPHEDGRCAQQQVARNGPRLWEAICEIGTLQSRNNATFNC